MRRRPAGRHGAPHRARNRARLGWLVATAVAAAALGLTSIAASADNVTVSGDTLRTGWDSQEPGLSPADVTAGDFGRQFDTVLDGSVYAQPLVVGATVLVTTEKATTYALDSITGAVRWSRHFGSPFQSSSIGCGDLTPDLGSTSTPVYDPASSTVYLTTKLADGATVTQPHWYLQAVDVATGAERPGYPLLLQGTADNDPTVTFTPFVEHQRTGLLLAGGVVYIGFGSHCDIGAWRGWVMGVAVGASPHIQSAWTTEVANGSGGGVWQAGGGLVSDGTDASGSPRIFLSTGNGISPPTGAGNSPPGLLGDSVVRLGLDGTGHLVARDFFAPTNAASLAQNDLDLGSGGPTGLPDSFGTPSHPHLLVEDGKDGRLFLLDRDHLGGRSQGTGGGDDVVQVLGPFKGVWGHPAVYGGEGGWVYEVENGGPLRAYKRTTTASGDPALAAVGNSAQNFAYTSGSPIVTSTGTTAGSGLVWVLSSTGSSGQNAQLQAYDAVPTAGTLRLRWSAPVGTAAKFAMPVSAAGRVYLGTRDGHLLAFGRPAAGALTVSPVDFGFVPVGSAPATATATFTAHSTVTVNAATTSTPFAVDTSHLALPRTLTAGAVLAVPVTFTATAAGAATATLDLTTSVGRVSADLHAVATQPGLAANPAALAFGTVPTGTNSTLTVNVTNTGTGDETISAVTAPKAPFNAANLPPVGTVVHPQASLAVSVTYAPTAAGAQSGTFSLTSTAGTLSVPLSGTGEVGQGVLTLTPATTDYGDVVVGTSRTQGFDVANTGNIPLTLTLAKAPSGDFVAQNPVSEGITLGPGDVIHQQVTFTPTAAGTVSAEYVFNADTGQPAQSEVLTGTGVTGTALAPATGTAWTRNGRASVSGRDLILTPNVASVAGSAFSNVALPSEGLDARFTAAVGPGTGADGMTFTLLDATLPPTSLGALGGGLGFAGLQDSVAVTLDTYRNVSDPSNNFVGVADGALPGGAGLHYIATSTTVGRITGATHTLEVAVHAGHLVVTVDGDQKIDVPVTLPAHVRPGFTAATGGVTDQHLVRDVSVTSAQAGLDTAPPAVTLTSPTTGAVLQGTATVTASAIDDSSGVAGVLFSLDGSRLGATATTAPYQVIWDTTKVANGRHTLTAVAFDAAGNAATAASVTVLVNNPLPVDTSASVDGRGTLTLPPLSTTRSGDVLLALVSAGGQPGVAQKTTVSGGGLTWTLVKRANGVRGTTEVWRAKAPGLLSRITVKATPLKGGYDGSLTVLALTGTSGVSTSAGASGNSAAPSVSLLTATAGSWVVGVGDDPKAARPRTPAVGQVLVHQWVDKQQPLTLWAQSVSPALPARSQVRLLDTAPTGDPWNYVAVEVARSP